MKKVLKVTLVGLIILLGISSKISTSVSITQGSSNTTDKNLIYNINLEGKGYE